MKLSTIAAGAALLSGTLAKMPVAEYRDLPSLKEMDAMEQRWVQKRHEYIPHILKKHGYDAWILSMREYAEDTVFRALVSSTTKFSARRRTLYLFHTHPDVPSPLELIDNTPQIWDEVAKVLEQVDPQRIAVNIDEQVAFSDGLHSGEGRVLLSHLPEKYRSRVSSCRAPGVETVAARVGGKEQFEMYHLLQENVWAMIQEGFSETVIELGKTTANDLEWWFRDVMRWRFGVGTWFHPSVTIYRGPGQDSVQEEPTMQEGDMLHVDIGVWAMNMATDTQHLAYILRSNETSPPQSLIDGLHNANKMQDLVRKHMIPGRAGDDVFFNVTHDMKEMQLQGTIYSHPIGDYGHSAGAIIGMTNLQGSVPDGGLNPVLENYWTSVELQGWTDVPEWGVQGIYPLEEDVYWNADTRSFEFVFGQQTEFHLVRPKKAKHGHGHGDDGEGHHGHHGKHEKHGKHGEHGKHGKHEKHGEHGKDKGHKSHHKADGTQSSWSLVEMMAEWTGMVVGRWA